MKQLTTNATIIAILAITTFAHSMEKSMAFERKRLMQRRSDLQINSAIAEINESTRIATRAANRIKEILDKIIVENTNSENIAQIIKAVHGAALVANAEMETSQKRIVELLKRLHEIIKNCQTRENKIEEERIDKEIQDDLMKKYTTDELNGAL